MAKLKLNPSASPSGTIAQNEKIRTLEAEVSRLRSAIEELTVLNDLAIAASSSLEVDQMLNIIVEKSIKAVKAEQGSILLVTEQPEAPLKTLVRQADRRSRLMSYKVGASITGWVLKHQQPLMIENLSADDRFSTSKQERREIKTVLCVPIRFRAKLMGILTVTNKKTLEPFDGSDLRLLSIIAAQSGQLIRNSQLQQETLDKKRMQDELAMARKIQLNLLPETTPANKLLEISSYFNPADEVSGDYFDYFRLADNRIGIVMADVSGHGTSSALVMTMVKGILHATTHHFVSAKDVLTELNLTLGKMIPKEMFVTMVFMVFDLDRRLLKFSNAGHNPLLVFDHESKSCKWVELPGPALTITPLAKYQEKELELRPDDVFLVYTDGLTEAFNAQKEMFEETRLVRAVEESCSKKAQSIIDHVKERLRAFVGEANQSDDVAIIAIRIR